MEDIETGKKQIFIYKYVKIPILTHQYFLSSLSMLFNDLSNIMFLVWKHISNLEMSSTVMLWKNTVH